MSLRTLLRRLRFRPWGIFRRSLQNLIYFAVGGVGGLLFMLLRALRIMAHPGPFEKNKIKKILIFRPDRIGDLILATPALAAVRAGFPGARIALVVAQQNQVLVASNPDVDELIPIRHRGVLQNRSLLGRLHSEQFDLAILLYPALWCSVLAFLSKIPQRLGYSFHGNDFLLTIPVPEPGARQVRHQVEVNLDLLKAIGVQPRSKKLQVSLSRAAEQRIASFLNQNAVQPGDKLVVIHPGSFEEYIRWSSAGFARVASRLISEFAARVIILGGPHEEGIVAQVCRLMPVQPLVALGFSLAESAALIKKADLFIGNSSGPMHLAAAWGVPVVAIFGNIHPLDSDQRWGPYGTPSIVVHKELGCRHCHPSDCRRYRCMEAISAEDVLQAVKRLI